MRAQQNPHRPHSLPREERVRLKPGTNTTNAALPPMRANKFLDNRKKLVYVCHKSYIVQFLLLIGIFLLKASQQL